MNKSGGMSIGLVLILAGVVLFGRVWWGGLATKIPGVTANIADTTGPATLTNADLTTTTPAAAPAARSPISSAPTATGPVPGQRLPTLISTGQEQWA